MTIGFKVRQKCPDCKGTGKVKEKTCKLCKGAGKWEYTYVTREIMREFYD
jgi:DnaJ-class molecular chaperone